MSNTTKLTSAEKLISLENLTRYDENIKKHIQLHTNDNTIHLTSEKVVEKATQVFSNHNYIVNSNLIDPINQRGLTEYPSPAGTSYCIDNWKYSTAYAISLTDKGMKMYQPEGGSGVHAVFTFVEIPKSCLGKPMTVSLCIAELTGTNFHIGTLTNQTAYVIAPAFDTHGIYVFTFTPTEELIRITFQPNTNKEFVDGSYVTVSWIKLEEGTVATRYIPPTRLSELVSCQRWVTKMDVYKRYPLSYCTADQLNFLIPLNTGMRITPSITFGDTGYLYIYDSKNISGTPTQVDINEVSVVGATHNGVIIRVSRPSHGYTDAILCINGDVYLSAEL